MTASRHIQTYIKLTAPVSGMVVGSGASNDKGEPTTTVKG